MTDEEIAQQRQDQEEMEKQRYALVPSEKIRGLLDRVRREQEHNLPMSEERGKTAFMSTLAKPKYDWYNMPPGPFIAFAYRVHRAQVVNENTGEMIDTIRGVLIDKDGNCFASFSPQLIEAIAAAKDTWPTTPWEPPLVFELSKVKAKLKGESLNVLCRGPLGIQPDKTGSRGPAPKSK